ncbi:RHS repeat-associated protein [Spinactinospora alkalitolerans]|uniref:RHS repeat-associated protein n=1 Tax=Spinactinospora alkalitolerans TaxID=687207 RepID=A0A852U2P2_9ACTN|nr:RHS repeat-associated protein [Spinactinospora alkalitolerans]
MDLVLTAGVDGFAQVLVVHTPEAAQNPDLAELELALGTEGVTMTQDAGGEAEEGGGTGQMAVDAHTGETVRRRFTVFGADRGSTGEWPSDKGYVGGTVDGSTGLTRLGARAYDTTIGRFVSVDPVMNLDDPQQMHGYANGNPATWSDPSGLLLPGGYTKKPDPPRGVNDITQIKQEAMWTRQGRNLAEMRAGNGRYNYSPYYYASYYPSGSCSSSPGGGSDYGAVNHDPYAAVVSGIALLARLPGVVG